MTKKQTLEFKLFGHPEIRLDGKLITFSFLKVNALIYYLVVNKTVMRDDIAGMLWPDKTDKSSKKNLRNTIYQVNKVIGNDFIKAPNNKRLELNTDFIIISDVDWFMSEKADYINAYTDDFLKSFYIKDSQEYDLWISQMRQFYEKRFVRDCSKQLLYQLENDSYTDFEHKVNRLIKIDEFDEQNYKILMNYYQKTKRYSKVIEIYYQLSGLLEKELGILPSKEIRHLYEKTLKIVNKNQQIKKNTKSVLLVRHKVISEMEMVVNRLFTKENKKMLLIKGENGVGKSALCRSVLNHIMTEYVRLEINCIREEKFYYLRPFKQLIKQIEKYVTIYNLTMPKEWFSIVQSLLNINEFEKNVYKFDFYTIDYIESIMMLVLTQLQEKMPIIILFDDIHWMDEQSIRLLNRLIINLENKDILFLLTTQEHKDLALENMLNQLNYNHLIYDINILPFTYKETEVFIKKHTNFKVTDDVIKTIYYKTEGIPFYIEEYLIAIQKKQSLDKLTVRMQEFLREHFVHLNDDELEVTALLSYFEEKIPVHILSDVLEYDDEFIQHTIDLLIRQSFIKEDVIQEKVYVYFVHQKYKEYLYSRQTYTKKRMIHRKIAQAFEKEKGKEQSSLLLHTIAYHFSKARQTLKSLKYYVDHLQVAFNIQYEFFPLYSIEGKNDTNQRQNITYVLEKFEEINQLIDIESDKFEKEYKFQLITIKFLLLRGCFFIRCGQYKKGIVDIQQVIYQSIDQKMTKYLAQAYRQMIYYYIQINDANNMYDYVKEALQLAIETNNYEEIGILLRLQGLYYLMIGQYKNARQQLNESIHLFNMAKHFSTKYITNIAAAYDYLAEIERIHYHFNQAVDYHEKSLELIKSTNILSSQVIFYINTGITYFANKQFNQAKNYFEKANELAQHISPIWKQVQLDAFHVICDLYLGNSNTIQQFIIKYEKNMDNMANTRDKGLIYVVIVVWIRYCQKNSCIALDNFKCNDINEYQKRAKYFLNHYRDTVELQLLNCDFI